MSTSNTRNTMHKFKDYFYNENMPRHDLDLQPKDLPTMTELLNYCENYPKILTLRDSPLKQLRDPDAPMAFVHDWYIYISTEYTEEKAQEIIRSWERDSKRTPLSALDIFASFVDELYHLCQRVFLAPRMPWPDCSPMASPQLKHRLYTTFCQTISSLLPPLFHQQRHNYFTHIYSLLFANHLVETSSTSNDQLQFTAPCTTTFPYRKEALVWILTHTLDENLPEMVHIGEMSNHLLESQLRDMMHGVSFETVQSPPEESNNGDSTLLTRFIDICKKCYALHLTPPWERIVHDWIRHHLEEERYTQQWTKDVLGERLNWLQRTVLPWLSHILAAPSSLAFVELGINHWYDFLRAKIRLEQLVYNEFYDSRSKDIFSIMMEYPASKPVTENLMVTIRKTNRLDHFRDTIMESLNQRLLHQGASAVDIIQQYISCIRLLKLVDYSCIALLPIVRQVELYAMTYRNDTAAGVVEMIRQSEEYDLILSDDQDCYVFPDTELDEEVISILDESAQLERLQRKSNDLIAMIISMCGSRTKFVEAYKKSLARSLLTLQDYDSDQEVIYLELVKQRFPENAMISCDVMLKDMNESRRINRQVHETLPDLNTQFHSLMLSKYYWPEQEPEEDMITLPAVKSAMEMYAVEYSNIKPSRKLIWLPSHGSVTIELEFEDRCEEFTVEPAAALVISLFENEGRLTATQIVGLTGLEMKTVIKSLNYWYKKNILVLLADGCFKLLGS